MYKTLVLFERSLTDALVFQRLARNLSKIDEREYNISQSLITLHDYAYMKISLIEISKLIGNTKNDKISIYKIFNKLEEELKTKKNTIEKETLKQVIQNMQSSIDKHKPLIKKIKSLRDQVLAHTDLNVNIEKYRYKEFFDETLLLLETLSRILLEIHIYFYQKISLAPLLNISIPLEQELNKILKAFKKRG